MQDHYNRLQVQELETALAVHAVLDTDDVSLSVKDGYVTVTGFVDNADQCAQAGEILNSHAWVVWVNNELRVRGKGRETTDGPGDDSAMAAMVTARLRKGGRLSSSRIHVKSTRGFVTLSGTVKTLDESFRAEQVALFSTGVREVNNALIVKE